MIDVVGRQSLDPEQMAVRERGLGGAFSHELETIRSGLASCNGDADVNEAEHLRGRRGPLVGTSRGGAVHTSALILNP